MLSLQGKQENLKLRYNRILLDHAGFFRKYKTDSGEGIVRDLSSIQFLIEELVSSAVIDIGIPPSTLAFESTARLPAVLKERVILIDKNFRSIAKLQAIFAPIAEEFGVEFKQRSLILRQSGNKVSDPLLHAIAELYYTLYKFLLGLEYELQIDIDLQSIKKAITILRQFSRSPNSRANLAILSGIFETYKPQTLTSLEFHSVAPDRLISLFQEFVQDETYRQMSVQAHSLGFPARVQRSLTIIGRLAKKFIIKAPFKQIVNVSSRVISTATHMPVPDAEMAVSLIKKEYLPPIISLKRPIQKAKETWKLVKGIPEEEVW